MSYKDLNLTCRDCGKSFVFTAGEQEFYSQKGFLNNPVRCPDCRRARKESRSSSQSTLPHPGQNEHHG
ncbi:MAG: cytochrome C551 [Chloroflexaceae bacterium]|nr:cytochrome C551 [Chloroflexaceae bacterium]